LKAIEKEGFQEEKGTTIGLDAIDTPTTLESNKSLRDMQVLKHHAFYSEQRYETVGRVYVGLPPQFATLER
jgi:hypothetical protein